MIRKLLLYVAIAVAALACTEKPQQEQVVQQAAPAFASAHINKVLAQMTEIMVNDVTNPPLAARFFSYTCLAGYEVVAQQDDAFRSMHGVLKEYPAITKPVAAEGYSVELSALLAMMETAKKMQPSGALMEAYQQKFLDSCRHSGIPVETLNSSLSYAQSISKEILAYAKADGYNRMSNYPRYTPSEEEGTWYPTPPAFFAPVEPYFNTVRSFTLDTCTQFAPAPPVAFSKNKKSPFYKLLHDAYQQGVSQTEEHRQIASFWDCNPFALEDNGHLHIGMKKISPGAHWMGITGIACEQANKSFAEAMEINTMVAVTLMDGFIACWDEKFRSNRIRPETAIRQYIDPNWKPLLQTPPFPEYLSGHSTISSAAAVVLTHYFGDNFRYTDSVEVPYGLPARDFESFQAAAVEAGLSRFYGGIHFMDAIDNGRAQGLQVGEWVLQKTQKTPAKKAVVAQVE